MASDRALLEIIEVELLLLLLLGSVFGRVHSSRTSLPGTPSRVASRTGQKWWEGTMARARGGIKWEQQASHEPSTGSSSMSRRHDVYLALGLGAGLRGIETW